MLVSAVFSNFFKGGGGGGVQEILKGGSLVQCK